MIDSRRELPDAEPLDSFVPDIRLPLDDSRMVEKYRIHEINRKYENKNIFIYRYRFFIHELTEYGTE